MVAFHKIVFLTFSVAFVTSASAQKGHSELVSVRKSVSRLEYSQENIKDVSALPQKTILAFRTNLLYDALTLLNIGIEYPFYEDHFSIVYDHQFPWWRGGDYRNKFCLRYLQMSGEFRWWFLPKPIEESRNRKRRERLIGHFLGSYIMGGKYDFQRKRNVCYQGEFWSTGLSYGYVMPLGKSKLNLEFSISIGYASIPYRHFFPSEDYSKLCLDTQKIGKWHYVGVTKIGITLTYPLTIMKKKGGKR